MNKLTEGGLFINKTLGSYSNVVFKMCTRKGRVEDSFMEAFGFSTPLSAVWNKSVIEEGIITMPGFNIVKFFVKLDEPRQTFQGTDVGFCKQYGFEFKFQDNITTVYKTEVRDVVNPSRYCMYVSDHEISAIMTNPSKVLIDMFEVIDAICDPDDANYVKISAVQLIKVGEPASITISNQEDKIIVPFSQALSYELMTAQYSRITLQKKGDFLCMGLKGQ